MLKKLAIITTHPIQYNAPFFKLLTKRGIVQIKVFYTWGEGVLKNKFDPGFGKTIEWDIPLLDGYDFCFVKNIAVKPGSHHFRGIDNPTLINEIASYKADAILVYGWAFKSHLKAIRFFFQKIPIYFRGDSVSLTITNPLKKSIRKLFLKWVYSYIDYALYVGTHNNRYFLENGLKSSQLLFCPHAVDNNRFFYNENENIAAANNWRLDLGIASEAIVFLYAGKLDLNKNTVFLLRAFFAVQNRNSHLLIVGNGKNETMLKKEFASYANIHFLPFQNQQKMPVLYRMANVYVLPSFSETWGLGINEAMACGCALLVSNKAGAAIDLVIEGKNGFSFNPFDEDELSEKLLFMIQHQNRVNEFQLCSKELIKKWDYSKSCLVIEKLIS